MQTIGQISKRFEVSSETLRRWEKNGLIPPARRIHLNKWRAWEDKDIQSIEALINQRQSN
jgi:DNA-binding transcriptional MerR regulator